MNKVTQILKSIFPVLYLKRVFLYYNKFKIKTWDRFFYPKFLVKDYNEHKLKNPFLELEVNIDEFSEQVKDKLKIWRNTEWTQDQYLFFFKNPGFIDPKTGWALTDNCELIYPSLGFASAPHVRKPSIWGLYIRKPEVIRIKKVISLRDTGEENYFHFFNDVLAKLFYLMEHKVEIADYEIVISKSLNNKKYFQLVKNHSLFNELRWFVQSDEWIYFNEAIFCKPFTHTRKYFDKAVDLLLVDSEHEFEKRIFLTRAKSSLRFVENMEEIKPLLLKFRFEIVDTSTLTTEEQISLFENCRYLVAIHGAGITNIIFRRDQQLSVLEIIHPNPYIPFHYIMLARMYNFPYDVLLGEKGRSSNRGGFVVNPLQLEKKIKYMMGLDEHG